MSVNALKGSAAVKKILILTANPKNSDKLRLDAEVREIQVGLHRSRSREQCEFIGKWAVRPDDLRRSLLDHEPNIVHFSGHGAGTKGLVLENNAGQMKRVSGPSLARLFKLFQEKPRKRTNFFSSQNVFFLRIKNWISHFSLSAIRLTVPHQSMISDGMYY